MNHNFVKKCKSSFVIYIEDNLVGKWKKVLESHIAIRRIGNYSLIFKTGDITITLYEKPKKDPRSKLHIQSGDQKKNFEFIIDKLSLFYREACMMKAEALSAMEFNNMDRSVCLKCGKYFTNKKGVKQHMLRMHSNKKEAETIIDSGISLDAEKEPPRIASDNEESTKDDNSKHVFSCGDCGYKADDRDMLRQHIDAVHIHPQLLRAEQLNFVQFNCEICNFLTNSTTHLEDHIKETHSHNQEREVSDDIISEDNGGLEEENSLEEECGHIEERNCPTPVPEKVYICGEFNIGMEGEEEIQQHMTNQGLKSIGSAGALLPGRVPPARKVDHI
jgi:hypothetical protein